VPRASAVESVQKLGGLTLLNGMAAGPTARRRCDRRPGCRLRQAVRTCSIRCAPRGDQRLCCKDCRRLRATATGSKIRRRPGTARR
jgi:hypothetical protein